MDPVRAPFPFRILMRPANWPLAAVLAAGWLVARFPRAAMGFLARPLAAALWRWPKFRRVTQENLAACLPHLPEDARERLARASTRHVATSVLTAVKTWFSYRPGHPDFEARFAGLAHFEAARDSGKGIILLNCHYNSTELNGAYCAQLPRGARRFIGIYRAPSHAGADAVLHWARTAFVDRLLPARDIRAITRGLKDGDVVWFATDLEVGGRGAVFADFFGVAASTSNSLARIAGMTDAIVLPVRLRAEPGTGRETLEILPPMEGFPSGDAVADATAMNACFEAMIAEDPAPYWWCLERFRIRPRGAPSVYSTR
ncbi:MAG: lysophospholipid acyltransferase family protein [Roseicyclus sp.]